MTSARTMDFRARLRPWIKGLKCETSLNGAPTRSEVTDALESGVVRVTVFPSSSVVSNGSAAEGLELLSLLAQVDYNEWKTAIQAIWPEGAIVWCHHFQGRRFRLGCQIITKRPGVFTKCCDRFLVSDVAWVTSKRYEALRQDLEVAIDRRSRHESATTVQTLGDQSIPVRLVFANDTGDIETHWDALWLEVVQLAAMQVACAQDESSRRWKPLFRLDAVLPFSYARIWKKKDLQYARQIAACGLAVQHVRLYDLDITETEAQLYIPSIQDLLATDSSKNDSASRFHAADAVGVHQLATAQTVDSIFSAVLMSSSVRELHVREPHWLREEVPDDRRRVWQWIAVAVFGSERETTIEKLVLDGLTLSLQDVSALEETLNAPDPLALLFPSDDSPRADSIKRQLVRASSFRLSPPQGGPQARASTFKSTSAPMWVLHNGIDKAGIHRVLLPGWGQAWVEPPAVIETKTCRVHHTRGAPAKPRLEIVFECPDSDYATEYVAFFRVVGAHVRKITLSNCGGSSVLDAEEMRDMLRACPHLEELTVEYMHLPSLLTFAAAYEDGSCRVKYLELLGNGIDDNDSGSQFFDCLADENHPMSKHLIGLHFQHGFEALLPRIQRSALRMLEKNHVLQDLRLDVAVWRRSESEIDPDGVPEETFKEQDGVVLRGRGDPLVFKSKVAFLSIVWGKHTTASTDNKRQRKEVTPVSIPSLDAIAITTIFQFAANCKTRLVRVKL